MYTRPAGIFLRAPGRGRPDLGRLGAASSIVLIPNVTPVRVAAPPVCSGRRQHGTERPSLVAGGTQAFWTGPAAAKPIKTMLEHDGYRSRSTHPAGNDTISGSRHAAGKEAADHRPERAPDGPDHGAAGAIGFGDHGVVRNEDPLPVEPDTIMTVL